MSTRIQEALTGKQDNYILPFFWQHGETEGTLREYMGVIQTMGIGAVCLEARPHPDFAGPKWWRDVDIILEEARERNMKVWILDDCHFPTGYANGAMHHADKSLQKWTIYPFTVDLVGPAEVHIDVDALLSDLGVGFPLSQDGPFSREKELICAVMYKRPDEFTRDLAAEGILLTDVIREGLLPVTVPEGFYSLFLIYKSANAGIANNDYVNLLQEESVKILLDEVYEPHYQRYKDDFGKTIAGFFSDEPGFYNCIDNVFNYNAIVGSQFMPLPWSDELEALLVKEGFTYSDLIRLWYNTAPEMDASCRYRYMDAVTRLYEKNFSMQLGSWCRKHGVEYIGHILEDNNSSSRLGPSAGHYFRAMTGQDMSGIDVVTSQILPGRIHLHTTNTAFPANSDGEFYHYALAKLGASDAHIDPGKKGRAMCEIFGNYGWAEGAQTMKWLTDHMLVRGINVFVPHAFSPKDFPDPDCPPHFYAHGNNLQYRDLKYLFQYMNRVSHILSGGRSRSRIGILYHGEAEWAGEAMLFQKPGRICMEWQADYDVVPVDSFLKDGVVLSSDSKELHVGSLTLSCLIVPFSERLPLRFLEKLCGLGEQGFPILFMDALPAASCEGGDCSPLLEALKAHTHVLPLATLADYIRDHALPILTFPSGKAYKDLRAYHYEGAGYECVMLMNESISVTIEDTAQFTDFMPFMEYDAWENRLLQTEGTGGRILLTLVPGESRIFLSRTDTDGFPAAEAGFRPVSKRELTGDIRLSVSQTPWFDHFGPSCELKSLTDLSLRKEFRSFHGVLRYELDFALEPDHVICGNETIYLDGANEIVSVTINGNPTQVRMSTPYRFRVGRFLKDGLNHLVIENITTVFPYKKDHPSINTPLHPMASAEKSGWKDNPA